MRYIGQTAREVRSRLGMSQQAMADEIGVSVVHLCNIENGKSKPSAGLLDKYREFAGVDLYVLAWASEGDTSSLPEGIREAAEALQIAWSKHADEAIASVRTGTGSQCSTSET